MSQGLTGSHHTQGSLQPRRNRGHNRSHGNTSHSTAERGSLRSSSVSSPVSSSRDNGHRASILGSAMGSVEINDGQFNNTTGHHFNVTNGNVTFHGGTRGGRRTSTKSSKQEVQKQSSKGSRTQDNIDGEAAKSIITPSTPGGTVYDYSPEAYGRYQDKQAQVADWVDDTKQYEPANPLLPMPNEYSPLETPQYSCHYHQHYYPIFYVAAQSGVYPTYSGPSWNGTQQTYLQNGMVMPAVTTGSQPYVDHHAQQQVYPHRAAIRAAPTQEHHNSRSGSQSRSAVHSRTRFYRPLSAQTSSNRGVIVLNKGSYAVVPAPGQIAPTIVVVKRKKGH